MADGFDEARLLTLSADYSDDELDAVAELYDRPRLRGRRSEADRDERVRRAVADAALRGLVARRALVLEGSAAKPRVRLIGHHAQLLDPFVNAEVTVAVRIEHPGRVVGRALFVRGDALVVQEALPGQAIKRMTLGAIGGLRDAVESGLPLGDAASDRDDAASPAARRLELTTRAFDKAVRAVAAGEPVPQCVPLAAADLLHARRATATVSVTRREADGTIVLDQRSWLDGGTLGEWELVAGDGDPPATVMIESLEAGAIRLWLRAVLASIVL